MICFFFNFTTPRSYFCKTQEPISCKNKFLTCHFANISVSINLETNGSQMLIQPRSDLKKTARSRSLIASYGRGV